MTCDNLCTAAECAELRQRIDDLEGQVNALFDAFLTHQNNDVLTAHNYQPTVNVNTLLQGNELLTEVLIDNIPASDTIDLSALLISQSNIEIIDLGSGFYQLRLTLNGNVSTADFTFADPQVTLDAYLIGNGEVGLSITVGASQAQTSFDLPLPTNSNLSINGIYENNYLTLIVADGNSQDTAQILIDVQTIVENTINNITNIDGTGGGDGLSCDTAIQDCCTQLLTAINDTKNILSAEISDAVNNLNNEIDSTEIVLNNKIQAVEDQITIDIKGTTYNEFESEFELDDDGDIIPTYAIVKNKELAYDAKGLSGLHQVLRIILDNQKTLHDFAVQAITPPVTVDLQNTVTDLCVASGLSTRDDFDTDAGFFAYLRGIVTDTLGNSISRFLLKRVGIAGGLPGFLVSTTIDWGISFLVDKVTGQQNAGMQTICEAIAELEESTVTIIASEKEIARVEGKQLVLHFVTLDNYPKRQRGSNKRPVYIPAPKDSYDWNNDFLNIRWEQGNQFAKMNLVGYKQPISGWFKDADSANATFDQLLQLTTASDGGRVIPIHSNPRTDLIERVTRPYRAFISREVTPGEGETLFKYFPPTNEETN